MRFGDARSRYPAVARTAIAAMKPVILWCAIMWLAYAVASLGRLIVGR